MRWLLKCTIDSCKALILPRTLRRIKRRLVRYRPDFGRTAFALDEGLLQIQWLRETLGSLKGRTILEIGSGWEPLLPMLYALLEVDRVYLTDLNPLMDADTAAAALEGIARFRDRIASALQVSDAQIEALLSPPPTDFNAFLDRLRFSYLAPCDCRRLPLPANSVDVITSRSVFEHIPPPVLGEILKESSRALTPGGLICHFIDNSDHWAHGDRSISRVNFLRYSDRQFRWTYINSINYQNRLRHSQYLALFAEHGFQVLREQSVIEPATLEAVSRIPLASRFARFPREDLATTDTYLLARKIAD